MATDTYDSIIAIAAAAIQESLDIQLAPLKHKSPKLLGRVSVHTDAEREVAHAIDQAITLERNRAARAFAQGDE